MSGHIPALEKFATVQVVPPVIVGAGHVQSSEIVDLHKFQVFTGRSPLATEVGCAVAHRQSYQLLSDSESNWALIIEDDAEIANTSLLLLRVKEIIHTHSANSPLIVSFYAREVRKRGLGASLIPGAHFVPISISAAVCYLLNKSAAQVILKSQTPIQTTADWPVEPPDVDFVIDVSGLVSHLDEQDRPSTISSSFEFRVGSRWVRFLIWTRIWYLLHKKTYGSYSKFQQKTFKKRLYYHAFMIAESGQESVLSRSRVALSALAWRLLYGPPSKTVSSARP
jgi:GR25 family glycosyltransferase involved in LPS biosynthesis